jgi:hypothetical protein
MDTSASLSRSLPPLLSCHLALTLSLSLPTHALDIHPLGIHLSVPMHFKSEP